MAKIVCPSCGKKIDDSQEICSKCGYYFSNYGASIDLEGRPYNEYQESMHQGHYRESQVDDFDKVNNEATTNQTYYKNEQLDELNIFDFGKNTNVSNTMSEEEIVTAIDQILNTKKNGDVALGVVMSFWFGISGLIFLGALLSFNLFMMLFSGVFIYLGIKVLKTLKNKKRDGDNAIAYLNVRDFASFIKYVNAVAFENKNSSLLYSASLISYYIMNDKKSTRQYILEALKMNPFEFTKYRQYFEVIVNDPDLKINIDYYAVD